MRIEKHDFLVFQIFFFFSFFQQNVEYEKMLVQFRHFYMPSFLLEVIIFDIQNSETSHLEPIIVDFDV